MKFYIYLLFIFITIFSTTTNSLADNRRDFWTYEYLTLSAGMGEFEFYTTLSSLDMKHSKGNTIAEHQFELEVGMTDRYDFSIYQIFEQKPDKSLSYEGYKLRNRYRLGERGEYFVDPLLYFEYKGKPDFSVHEIEGKIILV